MLTRDALPAAHSDRFDDDALEALDEAATRAVGERSSFGVDAARFAGVIAARLPEGDVRHELERMCIDDLLLATAAGDGNREAIEAIEKATFGEIGFALRKTRAPLTEDEVAQRLRAKLFSAADGQSPPISRYAGIGSLKAYVRVTIMRMLLNAATRSPKERSLSEEMLQAIPDGTLDPEIEHARGLYKKELESAFSEAIEILDDRERALLRHVLAGLTVDQVGAIYDVHRATAARWIAGARKKLEARVRELLREKLGMGEASLDSVLRLARSHVEMSIGRHLDD